MPSQVRVCFVAVCCLMAIRTPSPVAAANEDEQTLKAAGLTTDGPALLDFFRKQTLTDTLRQRAHVLIRQLGADSFQVREKASGDLTALGPVILPLLRRTMRETPDFEVRRRARVCAEQIQANGSPTVFAAAARLLALRKPIGTAETLLLFLPGPYEDDVKEEIHAALVAVARIGDQLDPLFATTLAAAQPARRTAAAIALCRIGALEQRAAVRKLLQDKDSQVRWTVAQELAVAGDKTAVPVSIELLAELPPEQAALVEALLYRLAGATAPQVPLGTESVAQRQCRDAWRSWWSAYGERVEMAALQDRQRMFGYTLLVALNANRVVEWDRDGKLRWQIDGLASPLDAEALPGQRVLIAEYDTKRVTERNFKGDVLWEKKLTEPPLHAQRLPGGLTFIATRKRLLEVDRSGTREIVRYRSANGIVTARRFRDGRIGCIENGSYFELAPTGEERRRFAVQAGVCTTNALTLLPNGHLLIAAYEGGTVQEYDRAGKVIWQIKIGRPLCALRLPGGHTLVSSQDMVVIEYDRAGKELGRRDAPGHPCQIRRR